LPYQVWQAKYGNGMAKQSRQRINAFEYEDAMRYFDISLYSDRTIQRCVQKAGMMREKQSVTIYSKWHCANVTAKPKSLFTLFSQNAIAPKMRQYQYPALSIQTR
jgi:hypothetical protein